jgi:hypothetical protein
VNNSTPVRCAAGQASQRAVSALTGCNAMPTLAEPTPFSSLFAASDSKPVRVRIAVKQKRRSK